MPHVLFPEYSHVTNSKTLDITKEYDDAHWQKNGDLLHQNGKPLGLWYAFDSRWVDYVASDQEPDYAGKNVFSLMFKPGCRTTLSTPLTQETTGRKLLVIKTFADVYAFHKKYAIDEYLDNDFSILTINWPIVWQQYAGIEFPTYEYLRNLKTKEGRKLDNFIAEGRHLWFSYLSISSGCIWRPAEVLRGYKQTLRWIPGEGYVSVGKMVRTATKRVMAGKTPKRVTSTKRAARRTSTKRATTTARSSTAKTQSSSAKSP